MSSSTSETQTLWLLVAVLSCKEYSALPVKLRVRLLKVLIERALDTSVIRWRVRLVRLWLPSHCMCCCLFLVRARVRASGL